MDKLNRIQHNLLTYIAYCIPNKRFSYEKCWDDFRSAAIETEITTLRKEFSILKGNGYLDFKTYYHRSYPVLTQKGRFEIKTKLPIKHFGWDGAWNIVIFDLPEHMRERRLKFQKELKKLGFGQIARGAYISAHSLFGSLKKKAFRLQIPEFITYLKTKVLEDEKHKIWRAWDLKKINDAYEEFIKKAQIATFEKKYNWPLHAKRLEREFVRLYDKDPHIPEQFLPVNWQGKEAYNIFKAISNSY